MDTISPDVSATLRLAAKNDAAARIELEGHWLRVDGVYAQLDAASTTELTVAVFTDTGMAAVVGEEEYVFQRMAIVGEDSRWLTFCFFHGSETPNITHLRPGDRVEVRGVFQDFFYTGQELSLVMGRCKLEASESGGVSSPAAESKSRPPSQTPTASSAAPSAGPRVPFAQLRPVSTPSPSPELLSKTRSGGFDRRPGAVEVTFCVQTDGTTKDVHVVSPYPHADPEVDRICRETVEEWRFEPYSAKGEPSRVCSETTINVSFDSRHEDSASNAGEPQPATVPSQ